jgi:hypothetical protein
LKNRTTIASHPPLAQNSLYKPPRGAKQFASS